MYMKATSSADGAKIITGSTKRHIGSRLHKASIYAGHLLTLLRDRTVSKASEEAILEARAYYVSLLGASKFEKQSWEQCLRHYSEARLIYVTLARVKSSKDDDLFRDLLNTNIDPSVRYAAYQLRLPRTRSIDAIVLQYIPREENEFIQELLKQYPEALKDPATAREEIHGGSAEDVPKTIRWRSRNVNLEDATTAQALTAVSTAQYNLLAFLSSNPDASPQSKGAAYDGVLIPSQDAVDATKTAIDELSGEGVLPSDARMQSLQITRTAVNYALVGWRVGRNRVLCGNQDGAEEKHTPLRKSAKQQRASPEGTMHLESNGRRLKQLKEKVVLYDSTLQSLDSVKELPGVAADPDFIKELETKRSYFAALRCLALARSHSLLQETRNALALLSHALDLTANISRRLGFLEQRSNEAPNLDVTSDQVQGLQRRLESLVSQQRALVELRDINAIEVNRARMGIKPPLVERLDEYPLHRVDLTNLVSYPPKIEAIPVKPLFLDVAYNYIEYPGRSRKGGEKAVNGVANAQTGREEQREGRRGWFGFGR